MVYVISKQGKPLMPCTEAKARKLLQNGKAKCMRRVPFTIKLNFDCEKNVYLTREELAKNDGLSLEDFTAWFKGYDLSETMAIIHFTPFRYDNTTI